MQYINHYQSPIGGILLAADETGLTGLWFDGAKYFTDGLDPEHEENKTPVMERAEEWLDIYFSGQEPGFCPPIHMTGTSGYAGGVDKKAKLLALEGGKG